MIEVGKLYSCSKYLLLYPIRETATSFDADSAAAAVATASAAAAYAAAWSRELGIPVIYAEKNIPLLVLNTEGAYVEVLAGDKVGWIIYQDWLNIKQIVDAAA